MALLFSDGFDSYAATADLTKKWGSAGSAWAWVSNAGRNGGGAAQATTTGATVLKSLTMNNAGNILAFMFWLKISAAPAAASVLIQPRTPIEGGSGTLRVTTGGQLAIYNIGGTASFTGAINVCDNNWHWIEWKIHQTSQNSGTQSLYVDTVAETTGPFGLTTTQAVVDRFEFTSITSRTVTVDDIWVIDDQGAAPLVASLPFGMREIVTLRPSGDNSVQFTRDSGATNFSRVNEVNADGDTSYVQDGTSGHQDLYDYDNLTFSPAAITAVMANAYLENPNPGVMSWRQVAKSAAATTNGSTITVPPAYQTKQQPFPLDPNTSAAWTPTNLNAAQFGHSIP